MDRVVWADQEVCADICELVRGREHQRADSVQIAPVDARDVVRERRRVHRDFGMGVRAEQIRAFHTNGAIAKRRTLGRTTHDANVLRHNGWFPVLEASHNIAVRVRFKMTGFGYKQTF